MGKIRLFITFTFVSLWVFQVSRIDATVNYANKYCYNIKGNYTENSVYQQNLNKLFSQLSLKTPYKKFYNSTLGNVPNKVYVLYQCRADLSLKVCNECIESATKMIHEKCPFYKEAVIWYFECMLRYAIVQFCTGRLKHFQGLVLMILIVRFPITVSLGQC